jgi:hypothetical protein
MSADTELPVLDPMKIRISSQIGTAMLLAECALSGCGWRMSFSTQWLAQVIEVCNEHPCKPEPRRCTSCDHLMANHSEGGCWRAVAVGAADKSLVCPCVVEG